VRVRQQLMTGAGDYFSSGNDLSNFLRAESADTTLAKGSLLLLPLPHHPSRLHLDRLTHTTHTHTDLLTRFVNAFILFPKPIVAGVNGPAVGTTRAFV
jgi:peroxisomal 3,2-trans-enoyl-CoA isomerase